MCVNALNVSRVCLVVPYLWLPGYVRSNPSLFSLLTVFSFLSSSLFLVSFILSKCVCPSIPHVAVKVARAAGLWLLFDSVDHGAFIVTDGGINVMKFNPCSVVCLFVYVCAFRVH